VRDQRTRQEYLAEAKKAEEEAAKAENAFMRENWRGIAEGYRELAAMCAAG
jgi:hypothetical protein